MFFKSKTDSRLHELLNTYKVADTPLAKLVSKLSLERGVCHIDIKLPKHWIEQNIADPHRIHQELSSQGAELGIQAFNLNVVLTNAKSAPVPTPTISGQPPKPSAPTTLPQDTLSPHPRIRHIIAVSSGKGGVGKSTVAVNLALALQKQGHKVGMLDADIYGPSLPDMLGVAKQKPLVENGEFIPLDAFGMPIISIGSLLDSDTAPIAWRGIKATGALMQLYHQTAYPHLDYLIIDMPPGTGDIQLTLAQRIPITGAVIVTTPQHIALLDAKKGVEFFHKTHIPIIGIVENMAMYICSHCGHTDPIFGEAGGQQMADSYGVPLLGHLPLATAIREQADKGIPVVLTDEAVATAYLKIALLLNETIDGFAKKHDERRIF